MNSIHFDDETKEIDEKDDGFLLKNIILHHHVNNNPCDDWKLPNRSLPAAVAPPPVAVVDEPDEENDKFGWDLDPVTSYLTQSELRVPIHSSVSSSFQMISSQQQHQQNTTTTNDQGILILEEEQEDHPNNESYILNEEKEFESSLSIPDTLPSQIESISSIQPLIQSMSTSFVSVKKEKSIRFLLFTILTICIILTILVTIRYQWIDRQSLWNQHQQLQLQFIHLQQKLESLEEQQQQKQQQQQALMVVPNQVSFHNSPNDSSSSTTQATTTIWTTRWLDQSNGWFQSLDWNHQNCQTLNTWLENWHDIFTPKSTSSSSSATAESQTMFSTATIDLETIDDERKEEQKVRIQKEEYPNIQNDDTLKSTNPSSFIEFNWGFWNLDSWDISSYLWQDAAAAVTTEGMEEEGTRKDTIVNLPTWQDWNDLWKNSWYDHVLEDWEPWLDQARILLQDARWDRYVADPETLDECNVSIQSKENEQL